MYIDIVCLYNPYDIYFVLLGVIKVATRLNFNLEVVYSGRIDQEEQGEDEDEQVEGKEEEEEKEKKEEEEEEERWQSFKEFFTLQRLLVERS
ncbi:hypothetical protein HZH68_015772 [Vespula germanica]|uniref:Uncharacterized protein n=1 Tax=Vespula germanica TaxID=30212 RepID=A0A834J7K5_VESGE|nr:hypothetical protein HZH68_015772 [Vespula germanica]